MWLKLLEEAEMSVVSKPPRGISNQAKASQRKQF